MPRPRLGSESGKVGITPPTRLQFRRLPVRSSELQSSSHSGPVEHTSRKIEVEVNQEPPQLYRQAVHVLDRSSGGDREQVWSVRLHMRPIQWHLKRHWHVPEVLEKIIPIPQSLHPHLDWWLDGKNVLRGQPLHPLQHAIQVFTDASNGGWGAHLGDTTARGV